MEARWPRRTTMHQALPASPLGPPLRSKETVIGTRWYNPFHPHNDEEEAPEQTAAVVTDPRMVVWDEHGEPYEPTDAALDTALDIVRRIELFVFMDEVKPCSKRVHDANVKEWALQLINA